MHLPGTNFSFHPMAGGILMSPERNHTKRIMRNICFNVLRVPYCKGFVIIRYRSMEIAQRFRILELHRSTSRQMKISQNVSENGQCPPRSWTKATSGRIKATKVSLAAKLKIRKLLGICNFFTKIIAEITRKFPPKVPIIRRVNKTNKRFSIDELYRRHVNGMAAVFPLELSWKNEQLIWELLSRINAEIQTTIRTPFNWTISPSAWQTKRKISHCLFRSRANVNWSCGSVVNGKL